MPHVTPRLGLRAYQGRRLLGAGVAELVDAATSHVAERKLVWVRLPPPARPYLPSEIEVIIVETRAKLPRSQFRYAKKAGEKMLSGFRVSDRPKS